MNSKPSHVRRSMLILSLPSPLICDCIEIYLVHSSVLCFRRPLNSGFVSGRSIFSLILWFCNLINPSLPILLCFHPGHLLVIISYWCFMPGPSSFHSSNLCLYPTIHSCIRTFLSSADHPLFVYILQYVFFPSASLMCPLSTLVFVSGASSTRNLCTVWI
jgi:hypothetical protein